MNDVYKCNGFIINDVAVDIMFFFIMNVSVGKIVEITNNINN